MPTIERVSLEIEDIGPMTMGQLARELPDLSLEQLTHALKWSVHRKRLVRRVVAGESVYNLPAPSTKPSPQRVSSVWELGARCAV